MRFWVRRAVDDNMSPAYFLGLDAGNSKTIALISDAKGCIRGWGRGGSGDIYVSEVGALESVKKAVETALEMAALAPDDLEASCFSLVGADWPEDFAFWQRKAANLVGTKVEVVNDALGALRAGTRGDGVVVACGTGAAIGARRGPHVWHSSFWQEEMGGLELSKRSLQAVFRADLGLSPATMLTERALAYFGCSSVEEVLHQLTARKAEPIRQRANLSRLLLDAAEAGDAVALEIVRKAAITLGEYACVAARKVGLGDTPFPLVLAGGVLRHPSSALKDAIGSFVRKTLSQAKPKLSPFEPVVGALLLALETTAPISDYTPLTETLPPLDLFTT